ncbi:hypothetical protein [uncultured Psychroserpens sp.]|uniref:HD domain-containing protein n=1 Tax=uncultured Psychroserpens sp. TaxID=255436 RepID=UPI00262FA162|nr:hypothetical protein [uncultured Psychroserpens sp.]
MTLWLKDAWFQLASIHTEDQLLISKCWMDIEKHYTSTKRHYHNLDHIYHMLKQTEHLKHDIVDYDAFLFAIWYHDIIYNATKKNNEIKSAKFAEKRLKLFKIEEKYIKNVCFLIKSTQNHDIVLQENSDNAYLLDIDLSILGTSWEQYQLYTKYIRMEYAVYPDFLYNKGRKKAMTQFLNRKSIYFTTLYQNKFEEQARQNIEKEIRLLQS